MIHNERGLRTDGRPVRRHIVRVELDVEVPGNMTNAEAREMGEGTVYVALNTSLKLKHQGVSLLGRPNAKRATVAPENDQPARIRE